MYCLREAAWASLRPLLWRRAKTDTRLSAEGIRASLYMLIYSWFGYLKPLLSPGGYRLCLICISVSNPCVVLQQSREGNLDTYPRCFLGVYFGVNT